MGVGSGQFADVLKGDEVQRFLGGFVLPDDVRASAEREHPGTKFPKTDADVLNDVKDIWAKKGFLSPAELRNELVQRYTPNADPKLSKLLSEIELSRNIPEKTTGYLSKEHAYSATGLAHLYAKETGRPIAMAEVDFSNMGGTNEEFKRRIAHDRGILPSQVNAREAEAMTDKAVRHLCDTMTKSLGDSIPNDAKIVAIRTGGDEVRLIFTGIEDPAELNRITSKMHAMIEANVAGMGLQNHPHLKDPDNPVRNGFGAAIAIQDMRRIANPDTLIQELDEVIKAQKDKIGHTRLGTIDEAAERTRIEASIKSGELKIPDGQTHAQFVQGQVTDAARASRDMSEALKRTNPMHATPKPSGITTFDAHIARVTPMLGTTPLVSAALPAVLANSNPIGTNRPANVAPLAGMEERRASLAASHLAEQQVHVSTSQQHFLNQSVHNLTSIDPSAQVTMPTAMISLTEIHSREGDEHRSKLNPNNPTVQEGLKRSGLASVNDVKSHVMAVSFHNLAGLNSELGHNNADIFLRHFSTIMDDSFKAAGYEGNGKKPYTISHHGGGNFTVLVNPVSTDAKGNMTFMSDAKIKDVERQISAGVDTLNKKNVADFMQERGVRVTPEMRAELDKKGITTVATIPDPKIREHSATPAIKARVDGVHFVAASAEVRTALVGPVQTQEMVHGVREKADGAMIKLRDDKVMAQQIIVQKPIAPATSGANISSSPSPSSTPSSTPSATPPPPASPPNVNVVQAFAGAANPTVLQNQPAPHHATPTMGNVALAPQPQTQLNLTPAPQQPVVNPATSPQAANAPSMAQEKPVPPATPTKVDAPASETHASTKLSLGATGQKIDGHAGRASLAIQVTSEAARGNYVAAATTAAIVIAEQQGIKFVAKRLPVLGGVITAGMTLWGAGSEAVKGNWKKAGSELAAGTAETVGNIVGFGAGDALREAARAGMLKVGVKAENAPDKSGVRVAVETAYELGKVIKDSVQLKTMSKAELAKTIQADTVLPHTLNLKGHEVTLVQAMEDKTFRTTLIKNMEAEAKKNPELEMRVAALKEYGARLDAAPTATKPQASATAKPANVAPSNPAAIAATVVADAQYKSMTTTQLAATIQKDAVLPDAVKIGKNEVNLADALKDKEYRKVFLENLEKAQANGNDLHAQIAMVKAYDTALSKPQTAPTAQQGPKMAAPAMN